MTQVRVPAINEEGAFYGNGLKAAQRVSHGATLNICSPEFGADPTGVQDSTAAIQAAVDKGRTLSAYGVVTIICPAGVYRVSPPFIDVWGYTTIKGDGIGSTIFMIDSSKVNASTVENGVFHTGTYEQKITDASIYRVTLRDFSIYTSLKSGVPSYSKEKGFQHIAADHMNSKAWGITFNTYLGKGPADPDSVHTIENVEIWDTAGGLALLGLDDQGCKTTNLRVRRTWKQGLLVGKPFDHPEGYEGTRRDTGAADNKFVHADISGGNQGNVGCAGIEVYTAQTKFLNSTSWYHRRHREDIYSKTAKVEGNYSTYNSYDKMRDGAGWYVDGTRNIFIGCTSQETGGHGWVIKGSQTQMAICIGESASYFDTAGPKGDNGKGRYMNTAACFYIANWANNSQLYGLRAQDAYNLGEASKWGFYVENWAKHLRIDSALTSNSKGKESEGTDKMSNSVPTVASNIGVGSQYMVDGAIYPPVASASAPAGPKVWAVEYAPSQVPGLVGDWDVSEATFDNGKLATVVNAGGSLEAMAQTVAESRPSLSSMSARQAFRTTGSPAPSYMQVANMGAHERWALVLVLSLHTNGNTQYLMSSIGAGATNPASIIVTDKLGLRLNSGGGSKGYTAKTADNTMVLNKPQVLVMNCDGSTVQAWIDGVKSAEAPAASGKPTPMSGRMVLGAYYNGTNAADASFGQALLYSASLSNEHIAGLTAHLSKKWGA